MLNAIEEWSNNLGFIINPAKTQVLIVHRKLVKLPEAQPNFPKLTLCGQNLEYNSTAKFLGMTFDKTMSWKSHIQNLMVRVTKDLNVLRCIRGKEWGTNNKMSAKHIQGTYFKQNQLW